MEFVLESDVSGSSGIVSFGGVFHPRCTIVLVALAVVLFKFSQLLKSSIKCPAFQSAMTVLFRFLLESVCPDQGWANFLTRGPQWVLKSDRGAGRGAPLSVLW